MTARKPAAPKATSIKEDEKTSERGPVQSPMERVLNHIDHTGKELQAALDALWVEWNEEAQSGAVYWHAAAEAGIRAALHKCADLEEAVKRIAYPENP